MIWSDWTAWVRSADTADHWGGWSDTATGESFGAMFALSLLTGSPIISQGALNRIVLTQFSPTIVSTKGWQ